MVLPRPLPTPVLAFAIRHLGADAGVMVTASHNPPEDNGYKVYLGDGIADRAAGRRRRSPAQIAAVARRRRRAARADDGWDTLDDDVLDAYLDAVAAVVAPDSPRERQRRPHRAARRGDRDGASRAFARGRVRRARSPVAEPGRARPDVPDGAPSRTPRSPAPWTPRWRWPSRPTPDLVIANDPDADRCAVAVPDPAADERRGGCCAATRSAPCSARTCCAPRRRRPTRVFANSIVSSRLLAAMCRATPGSGTRRRSPASSGSRGSPGLRYGYEEALGYCVDPGQVRDKDGVTRRAARGRAGGRR